MAFQEFGHQGAPPRQIHNSRLQEEQIAHVRGHPLRDVPQFRGAWAGEVIGGPLGRPNALHVPGVVEFVACDAQDFHVPFLGTHALGRTDGNHRAVFVLDAVAGVAVGKEVQEMVFLHGKAPKVAELGAGERHVVGHKACRVFRQGVVDPNVNVEVLFSVAVVPKLGRRHPRAVHQVLNVACLHRRHALAFLPRHGHGQGPSVLALRVECQIGQHHFGRKVLTLGVVHEAIHGIHVVEVVLHARRARIQDVGVEQPFDALGACRNPPGMEVGFGQACSVARTIDSLDPQHVLGKVPELVTPRAPGGKLQIPRAVSCGKRR